MEYFNSLSDLHRKNGVPLPENPLISLLRCNQNCTNWKQGFAGNFYMIALKNMRSGIISYGRTNYDHESGSMYFTKPGQTIDMHDIEIEEDGFAILIHEDYLIGDPLHLQVKKYGYFNYELHEALHLSPAEEKTIWELYHKIESEYYNNQDEFSKTIITGHIASILQYADRFYKRQFINRTVLSGTTVTKFHELVSEYFGNRLSLQSGLPTVASFAQQMKMSPRYLSDLLKQETGRTAMELIHDFLITEAKNLLLGSDCNISEVAYELGFEDPAYFTRLFKKETGISPNQFKKHQLN